VDGHRPPLFGPRHNNTGEEKSTLQTNNPWAPPHMPMGRRRFIPSESEQPLRTEQPVAKLEAPAPRRLRERFAPLEPAQDPSVKGLEHKGHFGIHAEDVPPVPAPIKARPVRSDSLLEAIIKLVNSILTFKGK